MRGGALTGIGYDLPVASAQLKSALVLAALQAQGDERRCASRARSRDHTERMLRVLGAPIAVDAGSGAVVVDPAGWNGKLRAVPIVIPGDLSSATFLFVAAATVAGSDVTVENVGLNPTRVGRARRAARDGRGPRGRAGGRGDGRAGRPRARARVSACAARSIAGELALRAIDEIPALAVAAALAEGETVFADLAELRVKESDRIVAIARELRRAGVAVEERPDGLVVTGLGGRPPAGGTVAARARSPHRDGGRGPGAVGAATRPSSPPPTSPRRSRPSPRRWPRSARRSDGAPFELSRRSERLSRRRRRRARRTVQTFAAAHLPSVIRKSIRFLQSVPSIAPRQTSSCPG